MPALYRSVGEELAHYDLDVESAALTKRMAVLLPEKVHYVWPHPRERYLYVVWSDGSGSAPGSHHGLSAFAIDHDGGLHAHGPSKTLPHRPIHMSLDATGRYALVAHNFPATVTVHRINADGTLGAEVPQPATLDTGIYPHQIRAMPSNRTVVLVTRGNKAKREKPEEPGALKLFRFNEGVLENFASIAPGGGYGFGPRHLDFHPTRPWVYVSLERQNKLQLFELQGDGFTSAPLFTKDALADPANERPRQLVGTVHVHPDGRFVYIANRADHTVDYNGRQVFGGGENTIAAYAIDEKSGEPNLIQHADPQAFHVRTFAFDPSGKVMVAASIIPMKVRGASGVVTVSAALSVFRIQDDGKLDLVRKYDVETGKKQQFWMGII